MREVDRSHRSSPDAVELPAPFVDRYLNDRIEVVRKRQDQLALLLPPWHEYFEYQLQGARLLLSRSGSSVQAELRDGKDKGHFGEDHFDTLFCRADIESGHVASLTVPAARAVTGDTASASNEVPPVLRMIDTYLAEAEQRELALRLQRTTVLEELLIGKNSLELYGAYPANHDTVVTAGGESAFVVRRLSMYSVAIESGSRLTSAFADESILERQGRWSLRAEFGLLAPFHGEITDAVLTDHVFPRKITLAEGTVVFQALRSLDQEFFSPLARHLREVSRAY